MIETLFKFILIDVTYLIDVISVIIISLGVILSIARFFAGIIGRSKPITIDAMRLELGRSIVLAVEFLLAADIIRTMVTPDYYSIGLLGCLVIIRTVLTYFLNLEIQGLVHHKK